MKAENSETQTKSDTQYYRSFKGKSELILQDNSSYKENAIKMCIIQIKHYELIRFMNH